MLFVYISEVMLYNIGIDIGSKCEEGVGVRRWFFIREGKME